MRQWRLIVTSMILVAIHMLAVARPAVAQGDQDPDPPVLSPYWSSAVSQWEHIIHQEAQRRQLDPDLIAALIWKESLGRPAARGPKGAVGLMMLMPFAWRPSAEELKNPSTNVFWGARTLAQIIRDGDGDLYYSLAAYNGSWEKIHRGSTRRYAASLLSEYAHAIALRYGVSAYENWIAVFAADGTVGPQNITVIGPKRPIARYTNRPWVQADIPSVPPGVLPHATAITFVDTRGVECQVHVWLITEDGSPVTRAVAQADSSDVVSLRNTRALLQ